MVYSVYNYLASTQLKRIQNTTTTHKRSELKQIYNAIVKLNQKSPLYLFHPTEENQALAIGLKEASMELSEYIKNLDSSQETSCFHAKKIISKAPQKASAELLSNDDVPLPDGFSIQIQKLALPQKNTGFEVSAKQISLPAGAYNFSTKIEDNTYSFQFNIQPESDNETILTKLSDFINQSRIGLHSELLHSKKDKVQLILISDATGSRGTQPLFKLKDVSSPEEKNGIVQYFGLNQLEQNASNALFSINGEEKESSSNHFIIDKKLRINLLDTTEDSFIIDYEPDEACILSMLDSFCEKFNMLPKLANQFSSQKAASGKILSNLESIMHSSKNSLEASGILFEEDGSIRLDRSLAGESIKSGEMAFLFSKENDFLPHLKNLASYVTLNPMDYVNKTLVTYPNYGRPSTGYAYISSIYSGMLFNYYC